MVIVSGLLYIVVWSTGFVDSGWSRAWRLFNVAEERNAATWIASSLWLVFALTAVVVGVLAPRRRWWWGFLAAVAAYASLDEAAELHEQLYGLGSFTTAYLPVDFFSYRWVIGGLALATIVVAVLVPLMLALPRRVMIGIVAGGAVFLLGAVGLETIGGHVESHFGQVTWHLMALIHVEELLEYLGVIIATWAVAEMILVQRDGKNVQLAFRGYREPSAPAGA